MSKPRRPLASGTRPSRRLPTPASRRRKRPVVPSYLSFETLSSAREERVKFKG